MKKVIFLDVDGTLVSHKNRSMPESTKKALIEAKKNGHYLVLCTGRTCSLISQDLLQYFDGVVASAGHHIFWGEKEIAHICIPKEALFITSTVLTKHNASFIFQSHSGRYATESSKLSFNKFFMDCYGLDVSKNYIDGNHEHAYNRDDIESIMYIDAKGTIEEVQKDIGNSLRVTGASFGYERVHNGEISITGVNKATGIETVLNHIGLTQEDSIAFGDGLNDLEMIEYAHIGVAMGNAEDELKAIANLVTDHVDENGIYNGFTQLNLIN